VAVEHTGKSGRAISKSFEVNVKMQEKSLLS